LFFFAFFVYKFAIMWSFFSFLARKAGQFFVFRPASTGFFSQMPTVPVSDRRFRGGPCLGSFGFTV
jgi:hypothetical protein